jgi:hypothetical protein
MSTNNSIRWRKSSFSGGEDSGCVELGIRWRKSSFSGGDNNDCVEVGARWRKSSFSGGDNSECVEVASYLVAIRDSKRPTGPVLQGAIEDDRLNH